MCRVLFPCMVVCWFLTLAGMSEAAAVVHSTALITHENLWSTSGFVENRGQWDGPALFLARKAGALIRLDPDGLCLALEGSNENSPELHRSILGLRFEGARVDSIPEGEEPMQGILHYFTKHKGVMRAVGAMRYSSVTYRGLYPGMSMVVKIQGGFPRGTPLEYDIVAEPGADLRRFVIGTEGVDAIRLDPDGSLVLETLAGEVRQHPPLAWTERVPGEKRPTICRYVLLDGCRYGFEAPAWDGSSLLFIDPEVVWSRFVGGESEDMLFDAAVREADGALLVAGSTRSLTFPELDDAVVSGERNGSLDAIVLSFDASSGELRGAAVLVGEGNEEGLSVALGFGGEVTVTGYTDSTSFPVTTGIDSPSGANAFVARLSPDLSELEYSTLLGGSGEDRAGNVVLGEAGSVWVLGYTDSQDFPVTAGAYREVRPGGRYDLFVAQVRLDGGIPEEDQIAYSTYVGGTGNEPIVFVDATTRSSLWQMALARDAEGRVYLAGRTDSPDFPMTPRALDRSFGNSFSKGFLTVLQPANDGAEQLVYSTYLGAVWDASSANDIALDPSGSVWVSGFTWSSTFPTTQDAYGRSGVDGGFLARLVPDDGLPAEDQLAYSSYVTGTDNAMCCSLDSFGMLTLTGHTSKTTLPVSEGAPVRTFQGGSLDAFITRLDPRLPPDQQVLFSTYLGGSREDRADGLAVDSSGRAYLVGSSDSLQAQGIKGQSSGGRDGFIAVLDLRLPTATFTVDGPHNGTVAVDGSASTTPPGTSIESYKWDFGDGATAEGKTATHTYASGRFSITLTVTNDLGLTGKKSLIVSISCPPGDVSPWSAFDVGTPDFTGSAWKDGEDLHVCAGGNRLGASDDQFQFVHREASGDFDAIVYIEDMLSWRTTASLSLMARQSTAPDSRYVAVLIFRTLDPSPSLRFRFRKEGTASARVVGATSLPRWLKLSRLGSEFVAYSSADGSAWVEADRETIDLPATLLVGVAACGADPGDVTQPFTPLQARLSGLWVGPPSGRFRRGDSNSDGSINISDPVFNLNYQFARGGAPSCLKTADVNDDGMVNLADPIFELNYLFASGPVPPVPLAECGADPTPDAITCESYRPCE